ncbi:MAG TPA: hypothetical protein C5S37_11010 [Methanophagales archaeon]|nr:hypothetical protein [Methanophagales archaeon]
MMYCLINTIDLKAYRGGDKIMKTTMEKNKMGFCIAGQKNKYYKKALKKEILAMESSIVPKWPPSIDLHPIVISYINQKITGITSSGEMAWIDMCVAKFKAVEKGLSLGTGTGRHEGAFLEKGFVERFDTIDLNTTSDKLLSDFSTKNIVGDLNFIQLPDKEYPLVIGCGVLHHIINLEHLLFSVNRTLTDDGLFIVFEYVGENKWQWEDSKMEIINSKLMDKFGSKYPNFKITKPPLWNDRPFESIRSSDIPTLLRRYFGNTTEFEITMSGALYPIINTIMLSYRRDKLINKPESLEEILEFAVELDMECATHYKHLLPCYLFGIYRKSKIKKSISVQPWTNEKIRYELVPHLPFHKRTMKYLSRFSCLRKAYQFLTIANRGIRRYYD